MSTLKRGNNKEINPFYIFYYPFGKHFDSYWWWRITG